MTPTKPYALLAWMIATLAICFALLNLLSQRGIHLAPVPYLVTAVELFLAVAVFAAGWTVRAYLKGDKPNLSGLRAVRFVMLGKAASHAGAMLVGWYGAQILMTLGNLQFEPQQARALSAAAAAFGALVLVIAGYMTERFGRIPPRDDGSRSIGESDGSSEQSA